MKYLLAITVIASFLSIANASILTCTVDNSDENIAQPTDTLISNLSNQNTLLIKRFKNESGQIIESSEVLIDDSKVVFSPTISSQRNTCNLSSIFNQETQRGAFTFSCYVFTQFVYDLKTGWAHYHRSINVGQVIQNNIPLKNCILSN